MTKVFDVGYCKTCGESMIGDGYKSVIHCPNADVDFIEPDASPVHCRGPLEIPYVITKNGMYYGHNSCGYVAHLTLAELYTKERAEAEARKTHGDCEAFPITHFNYTAENIREYIDRLTVMRDVLTQEGKF